MIAALALAAGALPPNTTVLAALAPGFALPGCSRPVAGPVEDGWDPADEDVAAMEDALALTLASLRTLPLYQSGTENPDPLSYTAGDPRWQREIVGIVRNGRAIVYGNYLPADVTVNPAHLPTGVCDGGPVFFGAEYDVATGTITHLAFNGGLGGPFWPVYAP
ncbi:hypothetical protein [Croceicoccus bisphenolivorans]|uniref:hypothetical protein n=1 Tax=Croceicoccus bisphenolivorans TaxID=1783232 RepID=UPI00082ABA3B|nr:hypothetical protein [Croceicoccus bisphenolivorans]